MTHDWKRFWAKPDVEIPLADHGFLYAPTEGEWSVFATEELRSFEQISALRCLMLLGEPGMGKSTAMTAEARALAARASSRGDLVLQVDLGSTRDEQVLSERIFGSPVYTAWATGASTLHLFLDGLDEAVLRLGVVADLIMDGLGTADVSRLALRVACRTADRLLDFEARLEALWGNDEFAIFQLAPLRRDDVRQAAADRGQDPDEFIRAVIDRDIVPLAIKPITLNLLLDLTIEPGGMPTSQLELYRRGLRRLAAEPSERRDRARDTHGQLRTGARLAVAERIAGATLLTGRSVITLDEAVDGTSDVAALAQLAGGTERDHETAVPTPFDVNEDRLREVLGSGLFSGRGDHLGWAHQTYGEFLAARYLVASALDPQRLLVLADDPDGRVVPQLRDVAGWTAALDREFAAYLLRRDPLVLLRGEVSLTDEQSDDVVTALLRKEVAEELDVYDPRNRRNLRALDHPGLAAKLRERLADRAQPQRIRELACELAGLCEVADLEQDLAQVAVAVHEPVALRVDAVRALQTLAGDDTRRRLIPLARDPVPEDEDDDLKGSALRLVCPAVVTPIDALAFLTPEKNDSRYGSYAAFIHDLPGMIPEAELPAALEWARRTPRARQATDDLAGLAEHILVKAADATRLPEISAALAATVAQYLKGHIELQSFRTRDRSDAFRRPENRRNLVESLVPLIRDGDLDPAAVALSRPRLIDGDDLPWAVWRLREIVGTDLEAIWAELVDWASRFEGADIDLVLEARNASPVLFEMTRPQFGPIELDSELEAVLRGRYRQEQEFAEEERRWSSKAPDYDAVIDAELDAFEAGDIDAYWRLDIALWGEPGDPHIHTRGADITSSAGWKRATSRRQARIAAAAAHYLHAYEPSDKWIEDAARRYHPASAGYRALRYLADVGALPDVETICAWAPAIVTFIGDAGEPDDADDNTSPLLIAARHCPEGLADAARRRVLAEARHSGGHMFVLTRLRPVLAGHLADQLFDVWMTEPLPPVSNMDILRALLDAGVGAAADEALGRLTADAIESDPSLTGSIAAELLSHGERNSWDRIRPVLVDRPDWARTVMQGLASSWSRSGDFRDHLTELELAELFVWLSKLFPRDEDPSLKGVHTVHAREQVAQYRDQILQLITLRATEASLEAIDRIEAATGVELPYVRLRAAEAYRMRSWFPPRPQDIVQLAAERSAQVVQSAADLQRVVRDALERLQEKLGARGQAHQLWDTTAKRPKGEVEISAWIADRLHDELHGREVVVNREVEIRVHPGGGLGARTDIHIDAIARDRVEGPEQITLVIEVKGCWNRELRSAMRTQLADRYLSASRRYGIYLPVWFGPAHWDGTSDGRHAACARVDRARLSSELRFQADALRGDGYRIAPVLLDASLAM